MQDTLGAPAGARRCRQAGVNGTLLLSACPGAHSPCRDQPGDLQGGYRCFGRLSQGQGPPTGLQLSPRKASLGLARRRPGLGVAPQGGRASKLVPGCAEVPDVDSCPHTRPHETTDALHGCQGTGRLCLSQGSQSLLSHRLQRMPSHHAASRGRTVSRQVSAKSGIGPRCLAPPACGETRNWEAENRGVCTHGGYTMGQGHTVCVAWPEICGKSSICSLPSFIMKTTANEDGSGGHSHAGAVRLSETTQPVAAASFGYYQQGLGTGTPDKAATQQQHHDRAGDTMSVLRQRQFS